MRSELNGKMTSESKLRFVQADLDFHLTLARLANNPASLQPISSAYYALLLSIHTPLPNEDDSNAIVSEHERLIHAIETSQASEAISRLVTHLSLAVGRWHQDVTKFIKNDLKLVLQELKL